MLHLSTTWGQTLLCIAAADGHEAIVNRLIHANADLESKPRACYRTPLMIVAERGFEAVFEVLLEAKADFESKNTYGRTPPGIPAVGGHTTIFKRLLEAKANVWSRDSDYYQSPLCIAARHGHGVILELLLDAKADIDLQDKYGRMVLRILWPKDKHLSSSGCSKPRLMSSGRMAMVNRHYRSRPQRGMRLFLSY
jgi:ankyrin repeat protein